MSNSGRREGLLYIVDDRPQKSHLDFARNLGVRPIQIGSLTSDHLANDPSIVVDVDLRKVDIVRRLKGILSRRGRGCRVFLIDPAIRVTTVHATVLGADCILPRPADPSDVHAAIRKHYGIGNGAASNAAVMQSINAGVDAIDGSFQQLLGNLNFDRTEVDEASDRIADAVEEIGVDEWLATVKGYHRGTYQHCMLVTGVASAFASKLGMSRRDINMLTLAGLLHDIGKANVPVEILEKPSALTEAEVLVMRRHPVAGHDYLTEHSAFAADALLSVRYHHEYLDGSGYPEGLVAKQIDDVTRIVTVCDIYAALIERRSYKEPKTPTQAMIILNAMAESGKIETSLVRELGRIMLRSHSA